MNLNVWVVIVWYHNEHTQRDPSYMRIGAHSTHPSPFSRTTFALFSIKVYYRTRWGKIPRPIFIIQRHHEGEDNSTHIRQTILVYKCFNHLHVVLDTNTKQATSKNDILFFPLVI